MRSAQLRTQSDTVFVTQTHYDLIFLFHEG
jgi:hypothetical protein